MSKKKVYCYNCAHFDNKHYRLPEACRHPIISIKEIGIDGDAINPPRWVQERISPEAINQRNDCKGWEPCLISEASPWWKFWSTK